MYFVYPTFLNAIHDIDGHGPHWRHVDCFVCVVFVACCLLQYYGEVLSKKPVELHRFYKDESTFCHASGTKEEVS